jgi:two-component system OmpR family response regulator
MKEHKEYQIYLVDDDRLYLNMLEHSLKRLAGAKTDLKTFVTGEECLREINETPPDIVILDYYLNSIRKDAMNGIKVLNQIKMANKSIQVIMLSNQEKLDVAVACIKSGAYDYIVKNDSALLRIRHHINLIQDHIDLRKKMRFYTNSNIILASLFMAFLLSMVIYAWRRSLL